nr:hypothetical protein Cry52Nrm3_p033 [Cryptomonas curvata]
MNKNYRDIITDSIFISKIWKKYFFKAKMSYSLKRIFYFEKNEKSKTVLNRILIVIFSNLFLFQQKKFFAFQFIFILIQEEVLYFHIFIFLYYYVNTDYKRGIEKNHLSRNDIRILHRFSTYTKSDYFFINENKNNLLLLSFFKNHNFFFSIQNILLFSNQGCVINLISNLNRPLFLNYSRKKYKIFISKR